VIACQLCVAEQAAAIRAHMSVAVEQLAVVERGDLIEPFHRHRFAPNGDDRGGGDRRDFAGFAAFAAAYGERRGACFPSDSLFCVVPDSVLPSNPSVWNTVLVKRQDEREAFGFIGVNRERGLAKRLNSSAGGLFCARRSGITVRTADACCCRTRLWEARPRLKAIAIIGF
jgi:hypothetical protein